MTVACGFADGDEDACARSNVPGRGHDYAHVGAAADRFWPGEILQGDNATR